MHRYNLLAIHEWNRGCGYSRSRAYACLVPAGSTGCVLQLLSRRCGLDADASAYFS